MHIIPMLLKEMEQEAQTTRKMLACIPEDKYDWQPHPRSMTVRALATHIAELPGWVTVALTTSELDFATSPYAPVQVNNNADLLAYFEKTLADGAPIWKKLPKPNWPICGHCATASRYSAPAARPR